MTSFQCTACRAQLPPRSHQPHPLSAQASPPPVLLLSSQASSLRLSPHPIQANTLLLSLAVSRPLSHLPIQVTAPPLSQAVAHQLIQAASLPLSHHSVPVQSLPRYPLTLRHLILQASQERHPRHTPCPLPNRLQAVNLGRGHEHVLEGWDEARIIHLGCDYVRQSRSSKFWNRTHFFAFLNFKPFPKLVTTSISSSSKFQTLNFHNKYL